ncbi:hypothetical protein ACFYP6_32505 [Streptomyces goshikiensis]|uniref:hypothetical protein n=1 Tax=Streptomyces goshikiensis TaxID=1942 RepID=UPI0036AD3333
MKASSEENFRRTLVFHHVVKEAEAFVAGLPNVAAQLHAADPELYPATVWADWLCGDHEPGHRRRVLGEFATVVATDGTMVEKGVLCWVAVPGEGIDTKNCGLGHVSHLSDGSHSSGREVGTVHFAATGPRIRSLIHFRSPLNRVSVYL